MATAGDQRLFIGSQLGNIYVLPEANDSAQPKLFLDFQKHVTYKDSENEQGLLGIAFHPKFKENGQFFVFYTKKDAPPFTNAVSRFTVSKDDPNKADPASQAEGSRQRSIFRKPSWGILRASASAKPRYPKGKEGKHHYGNETA